MVALVAVFTVLGPVLGGVVFWLGVGVAMGAVQSLDELSNLFIGGLAVSIALAPLGMIQAAIAGIISGLVSRGTLSPGRWIAYSGAIGAGVSVFSVLTVFVVGIFAREQSVASALLGGVGAMLVTGGVAAMVCAWICLPFRPRRAALPPA